MTINVEESFIEVEDINHPPHKLLYVAGPYSGDIEQNIKNAESASINLIKMGFHVITPHKNTSGYEKYEDDNITYQTWIDMDLNLLSRCGALYVMSNSKYSKGTQIEIKFASDNDMEIIYEDNIAPLSVKPITGIKGTIKLFENVEGI